MFVLLPPFRYVCVHFSIVRLMWCDEKQFKFREASIIFFESTLEYQMGRELTNSWVYVWFTPHQINIIVNGKRALSVHFNIRNSQYFAPMRCVYFAGSQNWFSQPCAACCSFSHTRRKATFTYSIWLQLNVIMVIAKHEYTKLLQNVVKCWLHFAHNVQPEYNFLLLRSVASRTVNQNTNKHPTWHQCADFFYLNAIDGAII